MKNCFLRMLFGLVLLVVTASEPVLAADGSLDRVKKSGKLRVAVDATYPPMEFEEAGKLLGFDVDFARDLARRLGVEAEFVVMDWDGITAGLSAGRYDIIVSSMNIIDERKKQVDFVQYAMMAQVFLCRQGTTVRQSSDLAGKVVAVQTNTTSFNLVQELQKKGIAIKEIKALPNATDTFSALKAEQADVIVTDEPVGRYYARKDHAFVVTGQAMEAEPVGVAVRKEDKDLRAALASAVEDMNKDGSLKKLSDDWFGGELGQPVEAGPGFWQFSTEIVLPRILHGMRLTLILTLVSGIFGIILGLFVSLARISRHRLLNQPALLYVTLFRGTPLLLQIFFIFYALPLLLGVRFSAMTSGILALSLNAAAYITEIFRAAIQSIDKGQMEAARALGMSYGLAMRRVILPQTFRRLIPPLVNELAALSKDTSLVSVVALHEMLYETKGIASTYLRPWEVYAWAAVGYLIIVLTLGALASRLEKLLEERGT